MKIRLRNSTPRRSLRAHSRAVTPVTAESREAARARALYLASVKKFEAAVRLFHRQSFAKALEIFSKLVTEAPAEVASRAESYKRMCDQKLHPAEPQARGSHDFYNLGIAQLNSGRLDAALENLTRAQKGAVEQDSVRYALAAVHAQMGHADAALEHLATAIQLRPANRTLAARDEDFAPLAGDRRFRQLIQLGLA